MKEEKIIKIFGLPRSCTNLTTALIRKNFECLVLDNHPCWKHGPNKYKGRSITYNDYETNDLKFLICVKNPLDWLWSLYCFENETKRKIDKRKFLLNNSWYYNKENLKLKPIDAYNILNRHWLKMYSMGDILQKVKFEDLCKNQSEQLEKIRQAFDLRKTEKTEKEGWQLLENKVKPDQKIIDQKFEKRKTEWTPHETKFILENLDKETLKLCGY